MASAKTTTLTFRIEPALKEGLRAVTLGGVLPTPVASPETRGDASWLGGPTLRKSPPADTNSVWLISCGSSCYECNCGGAIVSMANVPVQEPDSPISAPQSLRLSFSSNLGLDL